MSWGMRGDHVIIPQAWAYRAVFTHSHFHNSAFLCVRTASVRVSNTSVIPSVFRPDWLTHQFI